MNHKIVLTIVCIVIFLAACNGSGTSETVTSSPISTVPAAATEAEPLPSSTSSLATDALAATDEAATPTPVLPTATAGPTEAATAFPDELTVTWTGSAEPTDVTMADFPRARSIDVAVSPDGTVYVALGMGEHIYLSRSTSNGRTFSPPAQVSEERALVLDIERPAIAAADDGRVTVAWSSLERNGRIFYALSRNGGQSFASAIQISGEPQPETVLVRMSFDTETRPVLAWLENSTLQFARSFDDGESFAAPTLADDLTCECCHPQPLLRGEQLFIAYRNLEKESGRDDIRDIFLITSDNGGQTYNPEVRVSDAHWFINACPIAGPSLVTNDEKLFVSWMDGRYDIEKNFGRTDIWLASSDDGGQTFSANRRVNQSIDVYNNLPSLALDTNGILHIIWEALEADRDVIYYAQSEDEGLTFTIPTVIVSSEDGSGRRRPGHASLIVGADNMLYMTWTDSLGAHFMSWQSE